MLYVLLCIYNTIVHRMVWLVIVATPLFSKSSRAARLTDEPGLFFLKQAYFTVPISFTLVWRPIHVQGLG